MELVPTQEEVLTLLRETGALQQGHFECLNGLHTGINLETGLAMRYHRHAKTLSVGLSRKLRANPELRAIIPELSIVSATPAGLPVAYGLCEALRAGQVYWAEKDDRHAPMRFRQFLEPLAGEKVVLVDDLLRSGMLLTEARQLLEARGAQVMALAVLVYQPTPQTRGFGSLPLYCLARLEATYYADAGSCELCRRNVPLHQVRMAARAVSEELVTAGHL
ncbi:MAG TPA: phosphoribosyltransferase family protein [Bryobacteraceae bacterium]|nr:phosphoribosyltransferase family protein [Bryobacteraceae bacterium]